MKYFVVYISCQRNIFCIVKTSAVNCLLPFLWHEHIFLQSAVCLCEVLMALEYPSFHSPSTLLLIFSKCYRHKTPFSTRYGVPNPFKTRKLNHRWHRNDCSVNVIGLNLQYSPLIKVCSMGHTGIYVTILSALKDCCVINHFLIWTTTLLHLSFKSNKCCGSVRIVNFHMVRNCPFCLVSTRVKKSEQGLRLLLSY